MENKIDLILNLVKDGKITTEQAKVLMEKEKEYVYVPQTNDWTWRPYKGPFYGTYFTTGGETLVINSDLSNISASN